MDYCSSCRRHLNGALVCPGCGAYAPDIAPLTAGGRTVPAPAATALWTQVAATAGTDAYGAYYDADSLFEDSGGDVEGAASETEGPVPTPQGRAGRRRQRACWKKNQRRAVVATAVALVGGGLTVASMEDSSGHRAQAATADNLAGMGTDTQSVDQSAKLPPAGTGKHRKPSTTNSPSSTTGTSQRRSTATTTHTDSARTQPYTAAAQHTRSKTAGQQAASVPSAGTTTAGTTTAGTTAAGTTAAGTGTSAARSPAPTATGGTGSGTSTTTGTSGTSGTSGASSSGSSGTSQSNSAPAVTSPSGICVLGLICVS
ncbi:hypothetical protein [Streptomyces sp. NPDC005423]|uniref:SCO2400 family protein n=1 Tax=Streptomyces sp. NPDC005423 TaxID=3155343 RepID=UPI0033AC18D8